jgi:hypothetical protein
VRVRIYRISLKTEIFAKYVIMQIEHSGIKIMMNIENQSYSNPPLLK